MINLGYKEITSKVRKISFYYLTLNGRQIGPTYFSLSEVLEIIETIKNGEKWEK